MKFTIVLLSYFLCAVSSLIQFTPNQSNWSTFYSKPASLPKVIDHTPDGVEWLSSTAWVVWDGQVVDPNSMQNEEFAKKICPSGDTILGLRDVFYAHNPFADVNNPTKAEVDEWHRISIGHLRTLVGITTPIEKDRCLFARALWAQERRFDPAGPCASSQKDHCGSTFIPSAADQAPYLPDGHAPCRKSGTGGEGITSAPKSDIPWSIKWVRAFCSFLDREGFNGGHVGPFFKRTKFGWSFWDHNPANPNSNAVFTGKWGGDLVEF